FLDGGHPYFDSPSPFSNESRFNFSSSKYSRGDGNRSSMNARSLLRMALDQHAIQGGSHAQGSLYLDQQGCPRTRCPPGPEKSQTRRLQQAVHVGCASVHRVCGGGSVDVGLCRLSTAG